MPRVEVEVVHAQQLCFFETAPLIDMKKVDEDLIDFEKYAKAHNTSINYRSQFRQFEKWCEKAGARPLPAEPETIAKYVAYQLGTKGMKASSIANHLYAIRAAHRAKGLKVPATERARSAITGARRKRRESPQGKDPFTVEELRQISSTLKKRGGPQNIRDRALVVFGFASGLRRSSLAQLRLTDIRLATKGVAVTLQFSKTDQFGEGVTFPVFRGRRVNTCPLRTLQDWLAIRGQASGPVFTRIMPGEKITTNPISDDAVAEIVKRVAPIVGKDPKRVAGHTLRSSNVTAARRVGAPDSAIMRVTGHKNVRTLNIYDRNRDPFAGVNPLAKVL